MPERTISWGNLAVAALLTTSFCVTAHAADETTPKAPTTAAAPVKDPYAVPDGTPDEIVEFLNKLQTSRRQFATRAEAIDHAIKVQRSIIAAGDKILAQKTDEDTAYAAAEMKMEALGLLASAEIDGAIDDALKAAQALSKDQRKDIADLGSQWFRQLRVLSAPTLADAERQVLINESLQAITLSKYSRDSIGQAIQLGEALERITDTKVAGAYYADLAKILKDAENPGLQEVAEMLMGSSRRFNLPGNTMEVTGLTVGGEKFDWSKYRGKVVLVDFWATWCGPCIAELPNVKENYQKYHDQGFEVVGISLDDDLAQLKDFLSKEDIGWTNLFAPPKDGEPQQPPTAAYYGVTGIPTAILVNREGKVVSLNARGEMLTAELEKLFPVKAAK